MICQMLLKIIHTILLVIVNSRVTTGQLQNFSGLYRWMQPVLDQIPCIIIPNTHIPPNIHSSLYLEKAQVGTATITALTFKTDITI